MARLEHVGIAVEDVEHARSVIADLLGESTYRIERLDADGIRTHFFWGGSAKLELLEGVDENSPVRSYLEKRGGGLHHLAFEVADIDAAYRRALEAGYEPVERAPRRGADGKLIFFLHPKRTAGVLIEFCQSVDSPLVPDQRHGEEAGALTIDGLTQLSVARGSGARTPCLYLFEDPPSIDPHLLVRRLYPARSVFAAQAEPSLRAAHVLDALSLTAVHVLVERALCKTPFGLGVMDAAESVVLLDPEEEAVEPILRKLPHALVVLESDDEGLRRAISLRSRHPTLRLAAISDEVSRAAVIASHFEAEPT